MDPSTYQSLADLAQEGNRFQVPQYQLFKGYFGDDNYAHSPIIQALEHTPPLDYLSPQQRTETVLRTLQSTVIYLAAFSEMYYAVADCEVGDPNAETLAAWDRAFAYIVGSIEKSQEFGDKQFGGQLLYGLAKEYCWDFDTCPDGYPMTNDALLSQFINGQTSIRAESCKGLRTVVEDIDSILLVPVIQGAVHAAIEIESVPAQSYIEDTAKAYSFGKTILPYASQIDEDAEETINTNMVDSFERNNKPIESGIDTVLDAFRTVIHGLSVDCSDIGTIENKTMCCTDCKDSNSRFSQRKNKRFISKEGTIILGVVLSLFLCSLMLVHSRIHQRVLKGETLIEVP